MSELPKSGYIPFAFQTLDTLQLSEDDYAKILLLIEMRTNGHLDLEEKRDEQIKEDGAFLGIVEECCQDLRERFIRRDELNRVLSMFSIMYKTAAS